MQKKTLFLDKTISLSPTRKRDYLLNDEEDDDTENSGLTVSSVESSELPNIIAPSTKILRFPMKQD